MFASRSSPVAATQVAGMASPIWKIATTLVQVKARRLSSQASLHRQNSSHSNQHIHDMNDFNSGLSLGISVAFGMMFCAFALVAVIIYEQSS